MNKCPITAIIAASLLVSATSFAKIPTPNHAQDESALWALFTVTPGGKTITLDEYQILGGTSKSDPCSDLQVIRDVHSSSQYPWTQEPGSWYYDSGSFEYSMGGGLTCFKMNFYYQHKLYTTGNVLLTWDSNSEQYVYANPNQTVVHFNS